MAAKETLVVVREQVVAMLEALGFKTAAKWNARRLRGKLKELVDTAEDSGWEVEDDEELDDLLQSIIKSGGEFEVVEELSVVEEDDEAEGEEDEEGNGEQQEDEEQQEEDAAGEDEADGGEDEDEEKKLKKELKAKKLKAKKAKKVKVKKEKKSDKAGDKGQRVRGRKRLRACGQLLREKGMTDGTFELEITPELVAEVEAIVGSENKTQTEAALIQAWSALAGYFEDGV